MGHSLFRSSPRQRFCQCLMLAIWGVLALRLLHIQVFSRELYASHAQRQQISEQTIVARPGDILDRQGRLLATTLKVPSLYVDPAQVEDPTRLSGQLSEVLAIDAESLAGEILSRAEKRFLWVKRHLTEAEFKSVQEIVETDKSLGFRDEFKRFYPQGQLAAHVLGLRDIDGVGRGGVEESLDESLRGDDGIRRFVRDALGRKLEILEEVTQPPDHGVTVVLTLDAVVQFYAEQALDELCQEHQPASANVIVLEPRTGDVLAMASRPTFDPNVPQDAPATAWRNEAISAIYEPGSTFKPFVVAWGLQNRLLSIDESFDCERGEYRIGGRRLHDHHPYGELSLTDVIVKSSNIGMAKIGERIGNTELYRMATTLGFGRKTGIELPGEVTGLVQPLEKWNSYSTSSIPMGHEIAVTPLQMIAAHAILANRGRRVSPHLVRQFVEVHERPRDVVVSNVFDEKSCRWVVEVPMKQVVERGTGTRGQIAGLTVFGKTGTAQKVNPEGGYASDKNFCSFICGAPADDPQLLVLVVVDEPHGESQSGGTVAAPYASRILRDALRQLANE